MSRVVNLNSPGKLRNQLMRSAAEVLRHLSQKNELDEETKDMAAFLVFCFSGINESVDDAIIAWEKRDYWVKAARFKTQWSWAQRAASDLEELIRSEMWDQLPPMLIELLPHFEKIKIVRFTRKPTEWQGAHQRLLES